MKTLLLLLFCPLIILASIGKITSVKGEVYIDRENTKISAKVGSVLELKDQIITKNNSKAILLFNDNTSITVGKSSTLAVKKYVFDTNTKSNNKATFRFGKGIFRIITGKLGKLNPKGFKIKTSTATIGIRGSDGRIIVTANGDVTLTTLEGGFLLSMKGKEVFIPRGTTAVTKENKLSVFLTTSEFLQNNPGLVEEETEELQNEEEQENKEQENKELENEEEQESKKSADEGQTENNVDVNIEEEEIVQIINNFFNDDIDEQADSADDTDLIDIEALTQTELESYITADSFTLSNDYLTPTNIVQGYIDARGNPSSYEGVLKGVETFESITAIKTGTIQLTMDFATESVFGNYDVGHCSSSFSGTITNTGFTTSNLGAFTGTMTGNLFGDTAGVLGGALNLIENSNTFDGHYIAKKSNQ